MLLVNEVTLLPVLPPLAPAATLAARVGEQIAVVLAAHDVSTVVLDEEVRLMRECHFGKTANRGVVGVMVDFARLAAVHHNTQPVRTCSSSRYAWPRHRVRRCSGAISVPDRDLAATLHTIVR